MGARNGGWLSGLTMPMMSVGVLLVYTMGSWLPWHYAAAICTLVPLCLLAALSPYFDSPYWYFSIGKEKNAHMAIEQFRGPATNVVSEIFTIQQHVESSQSEEDISFFTAVIKVFTEKKYFKPFFILNFLFFLMIFSGKFTIDFYAVDFFQKTGSSSINEYISAVILAFIHLVGSLLFIALVKKLSRKLLLSISSLGMGISLAITGAWMYFSTSQTADWFPIISMLIYMLAAPPRSLLHPLPLHCRILPLGAEVRAGGPDDDADQHHDGRGHQNIHQPGLSAGTPRPRLALL